MKQIILMMSIVLLAVSCGKSKHEKKAEKFETVLDGSGSDYELVKANTEQSHFAVYKNKVTGEYVAFNLLKFDKNNMSTLDQYLAVAQDGVDIHNNLFQDKEWVEDGYWRDIYETDTYWGTEYDDFCECYEETWITEEVWVGEEWVDTSHWYTFYVGDGLRFSSTQGQIKDLETLGSLNEEVQEKVVATALKNQFSLSATRSEELAKIVTRFNKISSMRELTDAEKNSFAKDALGDSYLNIEKAMKEKSEGNVASYNDLLEKAAKVNNTTPESIDQFFSEYIAE